MKTRYGVFTKSMALLIVLYIVTNVDEMAVRASHTRVSATVETIRFARFDAQHLAIVGEDVNSGKAVSIPVSSRIKIFTKTGRLSDLSVGDKVSVRSEYGPSGRILDSTLDANVVALDVQVTRKIAHGFTFVQTDYYTGKPLPLTNPNRSSASSANLLANAALTLFLGSAGRTMTASEIAVGDKMKLYGFLSPRGKVIDTYRLEDYRNR